MPENDPPLVSYNDAARYAVKMFPIGFMEYLVPGVFKHWKWAGWEDSQPVSFPGDPERRCDTIGRFLRIDGTQRPVALALEFERDPSTDIYPREGEYTLRIQRDIPFDRAANVHYDVVGGIIFLTGPQQPLVWEMAPKDFGGLKMTMTLTVPCLRDLDAMATFEKIKKGELTPCLLAFGPLLGNSDTKEVAEACLEMIRNHPASADRKDLLAVADVMAGLNNKPDVWRAVFKEVDMDRNTSPLLLEVATKGEARGKARGEAEAAAKTRRVMLRELEENLKSKVPEDIRKAIDDQSDQDTLVLWHGRLMRCPNWDAVRQLIGLSAVS